MGRVLDVKRTLQEQERRLHTHDGKPTMVYYGANFMKRGYPESAYAFIRYREFGFRY